MARRAVVMTGPSTRVTWPKRMPFLRRRGNPPVYVTGDRVRRWDRFLRSGGDADKVGARRASARPLRAAGSASKNQGSPSPPASGLARGARDRISRAREDSSLLAGLLRSECTDCAANVGPLGCRRRRFRAALDGLNDWVAPRATRCEARGASGDGSRRAQPAPMSAQCRHRRTIATALSYPAPVVTRGDRPPP